MEELKQQQEEALAMAGKYCEKLIPGMETVLNELSGEKLTDTDEFLKHVLNGVNWIIEIFNGTKDLINAESVVIDKETVNKSVVALNAAMNAKDDQKIADSLRVLLVFVNQMKNAAQKISA